MDGGGPVRLSRSVAALFKGGGFERNLLFDAITVALPPLVLAGVIGSLPSMDGLSLTGLVVLALLASGLLARRLRRRAVYRLNTVSSLLDALREGDYSMRGATPQRGDAVGEVVWELNALSMTLREQRLRVEEADLLFATIIRAIDIAIFSFDGQHRLRMINPAGERLLRSNALRLNGRSASDLGLDDCLALSRATVVSRGFPGGSGRFDVRRFGFRQGGEPHDLLVITDLSRTLREEERQTWQRLIRVLGHELNNSLAPIISIAATLSTIVEHEPLHSDWRDDLRSGLSVIVGRSESLNRFMAGYTSLARLPPPNRREVQLAPLVRRVVALDGRAPVAISSLHEVRVHVDPDQIEQALINLVGNAVEAAMECGTGVELRCVRIGADIVIEIDDEGPGLSETENLFVPFFTTKKGGSGIGLVLARQIIESHGGSLELQDRTDTRGCRTRITFPPGATSAPAADDGSASRH